MSDESQNANQDKGNVQENQDQQSLQKIDQRLETIEKNFQSGNQLSKSDEEFIAAMMAEEDNQRGEEEKAGLEKSRQNFEDSDFDKMSKHEIVTSVMERMGQELDVRMTKLEGHFNKRIQQSAIDAAGANLQVEIKEMKTAYGDEFTKAYPDVLKIAEKNPNLSLKQAFFLATSDTTRGDLGKLTNERKKADDKAAGVSLPDSVTSDELTESLKGKKTHADVAREIAAQIGL